RIDGFIQSEPAAIRLRTSKQLCESRNLRVQHVAVTNYRLSKEQNLPTCAQASVIQHSRLVRRNSHRRKSYRLQCAMVIAGRQTDYRYDPERWLGHWGARRTYGRTGTVKKTSGSIDLAESAAGQLELSTGYERYAGGASFY